MINGQDGSPNHRKLRIDAQHNPLHGCHKVAAQPQIVSNVTIPVFALTPLTAPAIPGNAANPDPMRLIYNEPSTRRAGGIRKPPGWEQELKL